MTERGYLHRYPVRMVVLHVQAWISEKTLAVAVLGGSMSDDESGKGKAAMTHVDPLFESKPLDSAGTTIEKFAGPAPQVSGNLQTTAKLPPWFDRTKAKRHVVGGLEDPIARLRMMQWRMGASKGAFVSRGQPKPLPAKSLDLFRACQKLGSSLSGRRGETKSW